MLIYFIFALISATSFGISNAYWKIPHKHIKYTQLIFFRGLIASLVFGLVWLCSIYIHFDNIKINTYNASLSQYLITILLCFICSLGLVFFLLSINYSKISISIPLTSINIFSILTAVWILHESFKTQYYFTFILSLIGILLLQTKNINNFRIEWNKGASYAILASFFWGVTYALFKYPIRWVGPIALAFLLESAVTITALVWSFIMKSTIDFSDITNPKNIKHYLMLAFLLINGTLFFNLALSKISILILIFTGCFQMIVSVLFDVFVYKEKLNRLEFFGITLIIASIIIARL
jgi:drug/metabolite transporter (DMT)-like permease